jgi:purine-binding chemotaxis protein CheW
VTSTYVRIRVGAETYALSVGNVVEVAELDAYTKVPGAPSSVLGVVNLRGSILPVYELSQVLGVESTAVDRRLLVAEHGDHRFGLAVDEVSEVGELEGPSEESDSELLSGARIVDDELLGYLDVEALFLHLKGRRPA